MIVGLNFILTGQLLFSFAQRFFLFFRKVAVFSIVFRVAGVLQEESSASLYELLDHVTTSSSSSSPLRRPSVTSTSPWSSPAPLSPPS